MITSLNDLDETALVRILTEPKNALLKQYKSLFQMDGVELEFTEDALQAVAKKAIERKTGARGLRGILESVLSDLMFTLPSDPMVVKAVINADCVDRGADPYLVRDEAHKKLSDRKAVLSEPQKAAPKKKSS